MGDDREGDEFVREMKEWADKKAAEAAAAPRPELTKDVVINLAGMTPFQYAQKLGEEAKKHRVPMRLLEKAVDAARVEIEVEKLLEPHWEVKPADDAIDPAQLFAEMEARILQHVVMSRDFAFVVALWIGQTWIHEHATYSPILAITSAERDSGKSTLMGLLRFLVRRSLLSVGISAAALYRSIEKWSPTFVLDECDELFADNPDLLRVVNSGWTRGQGVVRCDPETNEPVVFSTFCPKAIAGKGKKMPDTMSSRTIFIEMKRRLKGEKHRTAAKRLVRLCPPSPRASLTGQRRTGRSCSRLPIAWARKRVLGHARSPSTSSTGLRWARRGCSYCRT
jgi:hypothetical protein